MSADDRDRYLTRLEGVVHEVFGGDPEEIGLRVEQVAEGVDTLEDLGRELRAEASRYERMAAGGWRLVEPFTGGEARCRKAGDAPVEPPVAPAPAAAAAPPRRLAEVVQGARSLPEAAARLRAAAEAYERLAGQGGDLGRPVERGRVPLE